MFRRTSKRPEILGCLDVRLNVLKFQDAIFTFPRTFRRTKIWNTWWINKSCPEIKSLRNTCKFLVGFCPMQQSDIFWLTKGCGTWVRLNIENCSIILCQCALLPMPS